jgi:hypothetical protein
MPYLPEICRKDTGGGAEYKNYIKKKPASSFPEGLTNEIPCNSQCNNDLAPGWEQKDGS